MTKKVIICILASVLLVSAGRANNNSKNQTLDSLIQVALTRNPALHAAGYEHEASIYQAEATGRLPNPQLSVGLLNLPRTSLSFDETPMSGVSLGLTQNFPWPGKLSAQADIARLDAQGKALDLSARHNSIIRLVTYFYYDYSYWALSEGILNQNLGLINDIVEIAQTRYANGLGSAQDALRAKTAKARVENRILMVRQKRSSALTQLAKLTDNPETTNASLITALPPIPENGIEVLQGFSNPMTEKASIGSALAKRKVDLATSSYWPNLMLGVDYRIRKDTPMDAVRGEDFLSFKIGISMPVWGFARQKNQTSATRQGLLAAQAEELAIINETKQQVTDIVLTLQSLKERTEQYDQTILPQARAGAESAQVAYEVGEVDFNGFLSAQLEVMNIELERLELLKQYHQQTAALDELTSDTQEVIK